MNQHSVYNTDRLQTARLAADRVRRLAWILNAGAVLLSILLTAALLDYRWQLPPLGRWLSISAMGIVITIGMSHLIRLWRHPLNLKQAALEMEAKRPDLGCVVSTAAEYLSGERKASLEYEPELVAALQEQAARRLMLVEQPFYRRLLRHGGVMSLVVGATLLFVLLAPGSLTALERVTAPWARIAYTTVEVKPGSGELPVGRDLGIQATFAGRPPKKTQLLWHAKADSKWQTDALDRGTNGSYSGIIKNLHDPVVYQVTGDDAVSPEFTVTPYVPPEVKSFEVGIQLPAYTKRPATTQRDPNLKVLRASQLAFRITPSCPLVKASLRFATGPSTSLSANSDGVWTGKITVTNEQFYWVELADAAGHKGGNDKPYHITVTADEPPRVEISEPGLDIRTDATDRVPLKIAAGDDFGVGELKLVFRKVGGPEQSVSCVLPGTSRKDVEVTNAIDLAPLHLKEYELVAYYAEAKDNNSLDGPGIGKSPVYFIEYTTKGEVLSQCNGSGQKINLLQIEKQIIAATSAIEEKAVAEKLPEIAAIQRQAKAYAEIFKDSFILSISPPEARTEFDAAIAAMESAAKALDEAKRVPALAAEDRALEHLYQVTRLLPELEKSMCRGGNCTKVVLEAIEKLKDSQRKQREQELPKILKQARALAAQQGKLNELYRPSQAEALSKSGENTNSPAESPSNSPKPGGSKPGQSLAAKSGKGADFQPSKSEAAEVGEEPEPPTTSQAAGKGAELDKEQQRLSESATALADKLSELSGKNPRVGGNLSATMREVSQAMAEAAKASRAHAVYAAQQRGFGLSGITSVIQALEQLLAQDNKSTDMAAEDFPKEYESLISEYLRSLSFAE